jgi:spore germination protein KC
MRRRVAALLAVLTAASLLQGCWNYREVDSLMLVAGVAVDKGYEGHRFHLTMDLADTSNAGKDKPVVTTLIESEGDSLFDAVRNAIETTGTRLYWANCQIVIVSMDVARESILPVVDYFTRDAEPRMTLELFVSEEKTAKEILQANSTTMSITSFEIDKMYELNEKYQPVSIYQVLYENYNTLAGKGRALTVASLRLVDVMGTKAPALCGTAIFDGDRLTGCLDVEDSIWFLYAADRIKGGTLEVRAATGNTVASLEVFGNRTTVKPVLENGTVRVYIHTETDAAIDELDEAENVMADDKLPGFRAAAESQMKAKIERVIGMAQRQYGQDIFGFGSILHRTDLEAWRHVEKDWDEAFRNARIDVTCTINIRNSTFQKTPVKVGDMK